MLISFVLSFRNELENIPELTKRISKIVIELKKYEYELIFINDNSTDNSLNLLIDLQKDFPITIINMSRRFGGPPCRYAGFEQANGDIIIDMDCDLQDPPDLIPSMIKKYEEDFQVVHTKRVKRTGESKLKMFFTNIGYNLINFFSEIRLEKNVGDFKLYSRKAINEILKIKEVDPYFRGISIWVGFKQTTIEYERDSRYGGTTKYKWLSKKSFTSEGAFAEFFRGITSFSNTPLHIIFLIGVITFFITIFIMIYAIYIKLGNSTATGIPTLIILISLFGSLILISLGIIGIYLGRIFDQTKNRPKYIVESIFKKSQIKNKK
jgi:dolichol-phosphate mannosyltransferase